MRKKLSLNGARSLLDDGFKQSDIARIYGCSRQTVHIKLKGSLLKKSPLNKLSTPNIKLILAWIRREI